MEKFHKAGTRGVLGGVCLAAALSVSGTASADLGAFFASSFGGGSSEGVMVEGTTEESGRASARFSSRGSVGRSRPSAGAVPTRVRPSAAPDRPAFRPSSSFTTTSSSSSSSASSSSSSSSSTGTVADSSSISVSEGGSSASASATGDVTELSVSVVRTEGANRSTARAVAISTSGSR